MLTAKLHACGLSMDAITFIYSYMKKIKQGVKINDTEGPFLFNILSNDLSFFINEAKLENFADDNTI